MCTWYSRGVGHGSGSLHDGPTSARGNVASVAWQAIDKVGKPPEWVIDTFWLQLSSFSTNALAKYTTDEIGQVTARILWAVLSTADRS